MCYLFTLVISGLGSSPIRGHCVVLLGKTQLCSHCASLHRAGVLMGTAELNAVGDPAMD